MITTYNYEISKLLATILAPVFTSLFLLSYHVILKLFTNSNRSHRTQPISSSSSVDDAPDWFATRQYGETFYMIIKNIYLATTSEQSKSLALSDSSNQVSEWVREQNWAMFLMQRTTTTTTIQQSERVYT